MIEAMYYTQGKGRYVNCQLCPQACRLADGAVGDCRVRKNIGGKLYSLNYKRVASYGYDPIEKKPLYRFRPGSMIFSIGSYGCNLACKFCQNWRITHKDPRTVKISDEDMINLAKAKGSIGIAYTYNEPTIWYEYVLHLSKLIKNEGLVNVLVTNGFINKKPFEELLPYIDAINIDLKSMSNDFYKDICKGRSSPVLKTIERAADATHVEVTSLLIDGLNTRPNKIEALATTIAEIDEEIPLHLSRYFPAYKMTRPATRVSTVIKAKEIAEKYLRHVYLGNI